MASYTAPGVYIKDQVSGVQTISQASASIGAMLGLTASGVLNTPVKIGSWSEFIQNFANGLDTPFLANSYLPYAVYGFFQNGGAELYVVSVKGAGAAKATAPSANVLVATAASEGTWGNGLRVKVTKNEDWSSTNLVYDVTFTLGDNTITVKELTISNIVDTLNADKSVAQWFGKFSLKAETTALAEEEYTLSGGANGATLTDTNITDALAYFDTVVDEITLIGIPGQTSAAINTALLAYTDNNGLFPILDAPIGSTAQQVKTLRKGTTAWTGCLAWPWGKINDPLTETIKDVPTVGHVMGVYARTILNRGVFKAPAGVDAVVRGFVDMEHLVTQSELSMLNPLGVVCVMPRPNAGIVLWGARSLNSADSTMRYVSDGLLNLNIKRSLYQGSQFAVFEPNTELLWNTVRSMCISFLENLRREGALKGNASEAYYVVVDKSNNTEYTINEGQLIIDVGYAPVKPAEFVVFRLAHSIVSQ